MSITPTADDYRAAARLTVALLDLDVDNIAAPELIRIDNADQACRTLVAATLIAATSIRAAARHDDTDRLGLGIHAVAERFAGDPA